MISMDKQLEWSKWMAAAQSGDGRSYQKLLKEILPLLTNFTRKRVPDELTDDIVQDVLMGIHKVRHTYDPNQLFHSWMFAIARHKIIDALRKNGRKISREAVSVEEIETFLADPSNPYQESDARKDLNQAMQKLSEKQRKVVWMMKIEGHSVRDVAKATDMSESAVKVTAHRAYKALKGILVEENND